jgi:hypothetical protein
MVLVSTGFELSVTLVDTGGHNSTKMYQLRALDFETATTDATIIIKALDVITRAVISGYRLSEVFGNDSFAYPKETRNTTKASLTCLLKPSLVQKSNIQIPAPVWEIFVPHSRIVRVNHPLVVAYTDLFKSTGQAFIGRGKDLGSVDSGKKIQRKRN